MTKLTQFLKTAAGGGLMVLLPVLLPGLGMTLLGAALFGGTFIGIVSLVLTMAGRFYPTRPAKMMGKMTISYGVAQIAAPAITGQLVPGGASRMVSIWPSAGSSAGCRMKGWFWVPPIPP